MKHTLKSTLALLVLSSFPAGAAPSSLDISYQNYNSGHRYTANNFRSDVGSAVFTGKFGDGNQKVVKFPSSSNYKRLRIEFDRDDFGSNNTVAASNLREGGTYSLEYRFRFEDDWAFVRGGKLPGLSGGSNPSGGRPSTTGMSNRIMWRRDTNNPSRSTRNYLESYHYWRGQALDNQNNGGSRFGDRTYLQNASKNTWYKVRMKVTIGSSSNRGRLEIWLNDSKKYDARHRYHNRASDTWGVDRMLHHFFYGGGSPSWAPSRNTHLLFDNVKVRR